MTTWMIILSVIVILGLWFYVAWISELSKKIEDNWKSASNYFGYLILKGIIPGDLNREHKKLRKKYCKTQKEKYDANFHAR